MATQKAMVVPSRWIGRLFLPKLDLQREVRAGRKALLDIREVQAHMSGSLGGGGATGHGCPGMKILGCSRAA